jgi:hypothetical protein
MKRFTIPIRNLPFGLSGHVEVTETPANRDWRDTAMGMAAVTGLAVLVLPYAFRLDPLGIVLGGGVLVYLMFATEELRVFTRRDRVTFEAVVDYEKPAGTPEGDGSEPISLLDMETDVGTNETHQESK